MSKLPTQPPVSESEIADAEDRDFLNGEVPEHDADGISAELAAEMADAPDDSDDWNQSFPDSESIDPWSETHDGFSDEREDFIAPEEPNEFAENSAVADDTLTTKKSFSWVTYGPIFGFALVVIFYLLPTLMAPPGPPSNELKPSQGAAAASPVHPTQVGEPQPDGFDLQTGSGQPRGQSAVLDRALDTSVPPAKAPLGEPVAAPSSAERSPSGIKSEQEVLASLSAIRQNVTNPATENSDFINKTQEINARYQNEVRAQVAELDQARFLRLSRELSDVSKSHQTHSEAAEAQLRYLEQAYQSMRAEVVKLQAQVREQESQTDRLVRSRSAASGQYVMDYARSNAPARGGESPDTKSTNADESNNEPIKNKDFLTGAVFTHQDGRFIALQLPDCERVYLQEGEMIADRGVVGAVSEKAVTFTKGDSIPKGFYRQCGETIQFIGASSTSGDRAIEPVETLPKGAERASGV